MRRGETMQPTVSSDVFTEKHLRVLEFASLFDGEFSIDWLQELTGERASIIFAALEFGTKQRWLYRNNLVHFSFIDGSEQEKLASSLSRETRTALHNKIADLLIRNLPESPDRIHRAARHLLHISNDYNGCRLLIENGKHHRRHFRDEEARLFYEKALDDLRNLRDPASNSLFIEAALEYCKVSTDSDNSNRVIAIIREAIARAESTSDMDAVAFLEMHLGKSEWLRSHYRQALDHFRHGWEMIRTRNDPGIQKSATIFGMFYNYWSGRYREVVQSYETLVPDVEDQFPKGRMPLLAALTAGVCLGHTGLYSQAMGMLHAIRVHGRTIGNLSVASLAGVTLGYLLLEVNRPEDAITCIQGSWDEAEKSKSYYARLGGLALLAYAYHLVNDHKKAVDCLKEYVDLGRRCGMTVKYTAVGLAICQAIEDGEFPRIPGMSLEEEIKYSMESGNYLLSGVAHRHQALQLRHAGQPCSEVLRELDKSVADLEICGHSIEIANSEIETAREYIRAGNEKKALEIAGPAARLLHSFNEHLVPDDIRPLVKNLRNGESLLEEILRLGHELPIIRDYRELSNRIISKVNRITGAERGAIFVLENGRTDKIVLKAAKNLTAEDINLATFQDSMKLITETTRTGEGKIMEFNGNNQPLRSESENTIQSCICVPLKIRNTVKGVLYHDNRLFRSAFKKSDLEILNYFASQAAIAMDNAEAWQTLRKLYKQQQLEKEHYEREYLETIHFDDFVGESPAIRNVFAQAEQVAQTSTTVLILGETGVGKELVARFIHRHSDRAEKPFIRVHCSALPESLISSELFGHEKGAYTGATSKQIGRFELADGGTIFLDEIGDISMDVQVRLLRVLQSKEFERVGGHETLRSDFRLLAATNRDLEREVKNGRFRRDLFYRLNVFPINVPPLRDRQEDTPLLACYFLNLYANKCNKDVAVIPREEMEKLLSYDWPGNVRELENVIERGVILSKGKVYRVPELKGGRTQQYDQTLTLRDNERNHILRVLTKTRGKVTGPGGAAEILDIHPNTLFSRMKKLGISRKANYVSGST